MLRQALDDPKFIEFFVRTGGGFNPLRAKKPWCMTGREWMESDHYVAGKNHDYVTLQTRAEKRDQLIIRNIQLAKLWRWFVAYQNGLPPMHPKTNELLKGRYGVPWSS